MGGDIGGGGGGTWNGLVGSVPETCLWPPEYMVMDEEEEEVEEETEARCGGEPASSAWASSSREGGQS